MSKEAEYGLLKVRDIKYGPERKLTSLMSMPKEGI